MKEQEIEKLREKLGDGFEVTAGYNCAVITVKDIWKGVEFAECVEYHKGSRTGKEIIKGQIYRIKDWFKRELVYCDGFEYGWPVRFFKPSIEAAYVEQLKAKAKELYGDIKDGDRFDRIDMEFEDNHRIGEVRLSVHGWDYYKSDDKLYFGTICIYQQGKWAKKIDEPIKVQFVSSSQGPTGGKIIAWLQFEVSEDSNIHSSGIHLAKCLEDYLNKS